MHASIPLIISAIVGAVIGMFILALLSTRDPFADPMGEFDGKLDRRQQEHPDTDLLEYLDAAEYSVFFNPVVDMWAVLTLENKMIASAYTLRTALIAAREKERAIERAEREADEAEGRAILARALDPELGEMAVHP